MPIKKLIQLRRDTAADWLAANPTLEDGEPGYETDTDKLKIGDGLLPWNLLPYFTPPSTPPDLSGYATTTQLTNHTSNVGNPHSVTKAQVGLSNVPNTDFTAAVAANTAKISFDAVSAAKLAGIAAGAQVNTVTSVAGKVGAVALDRNDVGLGNVDNTSDANKPISNATQNALNLKQATLVSGTNIKTVNGNSLLGSGDLPIAGGGGGTWGSITGTLSSQTDLQTALNAKEPTVTPGTSAQYYRGDKTMQTLDKSAVGLSNVDNTSDATKNAASVTLTNKTLTSPVINTPTGIVKGDVGLGNVDNTSDATKNAASVTLTNKTLTSPVLNTGVSGTAIDTDGTFAANSDTKLASQKATKTYVDAADAVIASKTIPESGAIPLRQPALNSWYADINDARSIPVDMVMLGDSISVLVDWPAQVANQLYNRFNTRTGLVNSVVGQDGYRSAGGSYGIMNGTLQGTDAVHGAHIGPGYEANYSSNNGLWGTSASNNATSPDAAVLDITSDISIKAKLHPKIWKPGSGAVRTVIAKWQASGQFAYRLQISTTGFLQLNWSTTGSNSVLASSTVAVPFTDEEAYIGASLDVNNGASGYDVKFYTSTDGIAWTQLGTTVTVGGVTSIFSGTSKIEIGSSLDGTANFVDSKVERTQIYSGLYDFTNNTGGTLVFDANFEAQAFGATSFTESSANAATVTVNASAGTSAAINTLAGSGRELAIGNSVSSTHTCSGVYVVFKGGGGTLTVKDGGSGGTTKATIDTSLYSGNNNLYWVDLTTFASHNIYIECSVGTTIIDGICTTAGNNTAGVLLWRIGRPGASSNYYSGYPGHGSNLVTRLKTLRTREPHVFLQVGYNDGTTTTYTSSINRLIDDTQTRTNGSIALMSPWQRGVGLEKSYIARTVAAAQGTGLIDAGRVIGDVSAYADLQDLSVDDIHPNTNGGLALAMMVYSVLSGDPIGSTMDILWQKNARNYGDILTGAITGTGYSIGAYSIATIFNIPIITAKNTVSDTGVEFNQFGSALANVFYGINKHVTSWGDTTTAGDASIVRPRATELSINLGASNINNRAGINGVAKVITTPVGNVGTGEDNLMSWTSPAAALSGDRQSYRIEAAGTIANNANAKTVKFYFGATTVLTAALPTSVAASWKISANVIRTGATTQVADAVLHVGNGTTYPIVATAAPAETLSGTVVIKCTGTATANNDIVQSMMKIYWEPDGA